VTMNSGREPTNGWQKKTATISGVSFFDFETARVITRTLSYHHWERGDNLFFPRETYFWKKCDLTFFYSVLPSPHWYDTINSENP
jgi:hypothetical protein